MKFKKNFNKVLSASKIMIEDYVFKCSNRTNPSYFARSGKMGFKETILFMLNMVNKFVQLELKNFFEVIKKKMILFLNKLFQKIDKKSILMHLLI